MKAPLIPPTALEAIAPPFFTASVSRPVRARALEPQGLDDLRDRIAGRGRRREREVNDAEAKPQAARGFAPDEFARARELEGEALDEFRHLVERRILWRVAHRVVDDAGAGDADVDDRFGFADAVECARHERVVLDGVGEADELRAREAAALARQLGHLLDDLAGAPDGVHVDAGARRRDVQRRAQPLGRRERFRYRVNEDRFAAREAFVDERRVAADEVNADFPGGLVNRAGERQQLLRGARPARDERGRRDRDALVGDSQAVLLADLVHGWDEARGRALDLLAHGLRGLFNRRTHAVAQREAERDRAHVEVLDLGHAHGL